MDDPPLDAEPPEVRASREHERPKEAAEPRPSAKTWPISRGDQRLGQYTLLQIDTALHDGTLRLTDYYWDGRRGQWLQLANRYPLLF